MTIDRTSARRTRRPGEVATMSIEADAMNVATQGVGALSASHRRELEQSSAIDPVVIAERGYRTLSFGPDLDELAALGIGIRSKNAFPGLLLPMFRATGEIISVQFKPA